MLCTKCVNVPKDSPSPKIPSKKVEIVNYALKRLLEQKEVEQVLELRGKVQWEGNLDEMRKDRRGPR